MIDTSVATNPTVGYIDSFALDALRATMPGRVYTPTDDGYDAARACFSLADQPSPAIVVTATNSDDVIAAVKFARSQRLPVGVRATGHNPAFPYQGGLMINTEAMQGVSINPVTQTARVEAGVVWGSVVRAAHQHGLAPLNGSAPHVGVVGYSLFGGFGWLLRKYGAAVDSVVAADIVTADGVLRHVSQQSKPQLFWALRGASGNFGVVTALEFKLYPVSEVYGGAMFFPLERAQEVLSMYSEWVKTLPEEFTSAIVLLRLPPLPELPEFLRGKAVITVRGAYVGAEEDGAALLKPLRAIGGLIIDTFRTMPYTETATIANDPTKPAPVWRTTMMLNELSPAAIAALLRVDGVDAPTAVKAIEIRHLGGAMTRVDPDTTSFSQRYAPFIMQTVDSLMNPAQIETVKRNTRTIFEAMRPYSTGGALPSWLGGGDYGVDRTRTGFTVEHYERLVALKDQYDPTNLFRLNHNIPPSTKK